MRGKKKRGVAVYVIECAGKTINEDKLRELIKQDVGEEN